MQITNLNGYMGLLDSSYIDDDGTTYHPEIPEGALEADYILWNVSKEDIGNYVELFSPTKTYRVLIQEVSE